MSHNASKRTIRDFFGSRDSSTTETALTPTISQGDPNIPNPASQRDPASPTTHNYLGLAHILNPEDGLDDDLWSEVDEESNDLIQIDFEVRNVDATQNDTENLSDAGGSEYLDNDGSSGDEVAVSNPSNTINRRKRSLTSVGARKRHKTYFRLDWKKTFKWLVISNDRRRAFCSICINHGSKKEGPFADPRLGARNAKTSALNDHQKSAPHVAALNKRLQQKMWVKAQANAQRLAEQQGSSMDSYISSLFKTAYWVAKHELPLTKFDAVLSLYKTIRFHAVTNTTLSSHQQRWSCRDFMIAIAADLELGLFNRLKDSPYISIIIDESNDIRDSKLLVIYILYIHQARPKVEFATFLELEAQDAETITSSVLQYLRKAKIDVNKLIGLGSDGCSTMIGRRNGVSVRLRRLSPFMINVHCIAHQLALGSKEARDRVAFARSIEDFLQSLYDFYNRSLPRQVNLKFWQEFVTQASNPLSLIRAVSTRWLSLNSVIQRVWRIRPAVANSLQEFSKPPHSIDTARYLFHKLTDYRFMGFLAFLVDVLQSLASLSTAFQKRVSEFQITSISSSYRVATLQITQWYLVPNPPLSPTLQEFRKSVQQTTALPPHVSSFRDVSLNRKPNDDSDLINDCIQYCQIIIRNLEERFADIPFITQFSIFVPKRFPDIDSPNFHQYGVNELDSLLEHYGVDKEIDGKTIKKIVDVDSTRFEWSSLKLFVAVNSNYRSLNLQKFWEAVWTTDDHSVVSQDRYPNLSKLAQILLLIPVSSVDAERGFSALNRIKNDYRSTMKLDLLNALVSISVNGPHESQYQPNNAINIWKSEKERRIR